jgi:hypothetical protein
MEYNITVKPLSKPRNWEVVEGFTYKGITIPSEFQFDGASIPLGLRWRFKHGGAKFPAAAMHDYLYRTAPVSKEVADSTFYELMVENGVSKHDADVMYLGVKYCGGASWRKRRREQSNVSERQKG